MDIIETEICVLTPDDKLAGRLEEHLDQFDLGVDFLASSWKNFAQHLTTTTDGELVLAFVSLGELCSGGLDAVLEADVFFKGMAHVQPVLIVEPWVQSEMDSLRLMTGFERTLDLHDLETQIGPVLSELLPSLQVEVPPAVAPPESRSASRPVEPSASAPAKDATLIDLEPLDGGRLSEVWLSRVLYSLFVRAFTGTLMLRTGQREQKFYIKEGMAGSVSGGGVDKLLAAFAWTDGKFKITAEPVPPTFKPYDSMLKLIYEGSIKYTSLNRAAERLSAFDKLYPIQSSFYHDRVTELEDMLTLRRFCEQCKGQRTWSQVISVTWDDIQEFLRVACYALDTDLVVMQEEKSSKPAQIKYTTRSTFNVRRNLTSVLSESTPHKEEVDIEAITAKLQRRLEEYESIDAYELFGLNPECGAESVRERYYKLVKDHHPDVVGGNISPEVKALAELLFIHVKDAYVELLSLEKDKAGARSKREGPSERHTSSVRRAAPSSARRAAEAQVAKITSSREKRTSRPVRRSSKDNAPIRKKTATGVRRSRSDPDNKPVQPTRSSSTPDAPKGPRRRNTSETVARLNRRPKSDEDNRPSPQPASMTSEQRRKQVQLMSEQLPPDKHFRNGEKFMKSGQYDKAREAFKHATKLASDNPVYRAHFAWARYMVDPKDSERVKEILNESLQLSGRTVDANIFMARIYKRDNEPSRAMKYYQAAASEDRSCVEAQRELRLYSMRKVKDKDDDKSKEKTDSFFGRLFQRKK